MSRKVSEKDIQKSNRIVLLLIVGIPTLIILMSTGLFLLADNRVIDLGVSSKGQLIQPPIQLLDADLKNTDLSFFDYGTPDPRWTFLVIGGAQCDELCQRMLYFTRQAHKASGKMMNDISRMYLNTSMQSSASLEQFLSEEHQDVSHVYVESSKLNELAQGKVDIANPYRFYLVDRRGWLMMQYQAKDLDDLSLSDLSKDVIKDLKRLMQ